MAQRGLAVSDVELIMEIGSEVEDGYFLRAKDCQAVERALKCLLQRIRRLEGKRLVVRNGSLVTAYHSNHRKAQRLLRRAAERDLRTQG